MRLGTRNTIHPLVIFLVSSSCLGRVVKDGWILEMDGPGSEETKCRESRGLLIVMNKGKIKVNNSTR